ncbi:hypothetical protein HN358_02075 [Candidatus Uhrbacteria bacterium]|jgi:hypothetical protein|nr:hypothetical protein [Candidatus Uhrbacteria bacterium]MBT7716891.1 hypothetical protein [Candidatus Uhrbacteria bacterium]
MAKQDGAPGSGRGESPTESPAEKARRLIQEKREKQEAKESQEVLALKERLEELDSESSGLDQKIADYDEALAEFDNVPDAMMEGDLKEYQEKLIKEKKVAGDRKQDIGTQNEVLKASPYYLGIQAEAAHPERMEYKGKRKENAAIEREKEDFAKELQDMFKEANTWFDQFHKDTEDLQAKLSELGEARELHKREERKKAEINQRFEDEIASLEQSHGDVKKKNFKKIRDLAGRMPEVAEAMEGWFERWIDKVQPGVIFPDKGLVALRNGREAIVQTAQDAKQADGICTEANNKSIGLENKYKIKKREVEDALSKEMGFYRKMVDFRIGSQRMSASVRSELTSLVPEADVDTFMAQLDEIKPMLKAVYERNSQYGDHRSRTVMSNTGEIMREIDDFKGIMQRS